MPTTTFANDFFEASMNGDMDLSLDTIKAALMSSIFSFNRDTHSGYADVSASEITAGNGYTAGGESLTTGVVVADDINDRATSTHTDTTFTAAGGDFPPAAGVLYYNSSDVTQRIICYVAFDSQETVADGSSLTLQNQVFVHRQAA